MIVFKNDVYYYVIGETEDGECLAVDIATGLTTSVSGNVVVIELADLVANPQNSKWHFLATFIGELENWKEQDDCFRIMHCKGVIEAIKMSLVKLENERQSLIDLSVPFARDLVNNQIRLAIQCQIPLFIVKSITAGMAADTIEQFILAGNHDKLTLGATTFTISE